jgi:DNA-binding HxlR family transcriptional regulator
VSEDCRAVSEVLARVGDKWTVLVVTLLGDGSKRFNELRRGLGSISQRMLTSTLKGLERDGLVTRTVFPIIPPRVDYELTKLGDSLLEPVSRLDLWARQNRAAIQAARRQFDAAKAGDRTDLMVQIANANDHLEARAHLIGRFAFISLEDSARCRSRGPPPRAILLIQTRRGTINLAVRRCTTSFR